MPLIRMDSAEVLSPQLNLLNPGLVDHQGQGFLNELGQIDLLDVGLNRRTGEAQQVFDDHGGPLDALVDLFRALPAKLRRAILFHEKLGAGQQIASGFLISWAMPPAMTPRAANFWD